MKLHKSSDKSNFGYGGFATAAMFAADAVVVTVQIISVGAGWGSGGFDSLTRLCRYLIFSDGKERIEQ